MADKTGKTGQSPKLQRIGMLGGIFICIVFLAGMLYLLIWLKNIILSVPIICIMLGIAAYIYVMWSNYRVAKINFELYQIKRWVEKCLRAIKERKPPESEYRFKGEKQGDSLSVETVRIQWQDLKKHHFPNDHTPRSEADAWKVISFHDGKEVVHGIFRRREWAYGFLFYVAAKEYAGINIEKWYWGFDAF